MHDCAEAIRKKCRDLGCYFPEDFCIFSFTDNTMNASCRPGGGPQRDGTNAPRNDPLIQRAFYNGWKKLHGIKFQTVDLPNGMNFMVWGPFSVRHNKLWALRHSELNQKISTCQNENDMQYSTYGDSAYVNLSLSHVWARHKYNPCTERENLKIRVLSSFRECIEWDYGDVGRFSPSVDFKKILKI
jgi:hypothetical protein